MSKRTMRLISVMAVFVLIGCTGPYQPNPSPDMPAIFGTIEDVTPNGSSGSASYFLVSFKDGRKVPMRINMHRRRSFEFAVGQYTKFQFDADGYVVKIEAKVEATGVKNE